MGCPDWPKCFGKWIPPTDVSQLPVNYQDIYADRGYADTHFDAYHTWVEYINRLLGMLLGLVIFFALVYSFTIRKANPRVFATTFISFLLIGFQGWLGSVVVASNLAPIKISIHMVTALILLAVLIYIYFLTQKKTIEIHERPRYLNWLYLALALTTIQIIVGTQVRQEIDVISKKMNFEFRDQWANGLSLVFFFHRSFSILLLIVNAYIVKNILSHYKADSSMLKSAYYLAFLITGEIMAGIILYYFDFPRVLQPAHLLLASLIFGVQFRMLLFSGRAQVK